MHADTPGASLFERLAKFVWDSAVLTAVYNALWKYSYKVLTDRAHSTH